jgi:GT2 family glycosyltransferase
VIINEKNVGYTRGNNLGVRRAEGEFIAIVNPDIIWRDNDVLQKLVDFGEKNPEVGIWAPKQINDDGSRPITVRAFPKFFVQIARRTFLRKLPGIKKIVAYDEMQHLDYDKTQEVDWIQSSFIMMRKEFWDELGSFDEAYFIFMSDAELCWQSWKRGKKVMLYPEAKVYADGIRCSRGGFFTLFKSKILRQHVIDALRYFKKHLFEKNPKKTKIKNSDK